MIGNCALCGDRGVALLNSHTYLPRFVYKRLRTAGATDANPVHLTAAGFSQSQTQVTLPLLCGPCEDRFNRGGERYVAGVSIQADGSFPLLDRMQRESQHMASPNEGIFDTSRNSDVDHEAITYFATSMLWRAQFISDQPIKLGFYEASLRRFLLSGFGAPPYVHLSVMIRYRSNLTQVSYGVHKSKNGVVTVFRFSIPGLTFLCSLGPVINIESCFYRSPYRPIFDVSFIEQQHDEMIKAMRDRSRAAGKRSRISTE